MVNNFNPVCLEFFFSFCQTKMNSVYLENMMPLLYFITSLEQHICVLKIFKLFPWDNLFGFYLSVGNLYLC